jgi:N-acetylated-alpha-linked acidic dipeptidase
LALREHVDELRRMRALKVRKAEETKPGAAIDFAGLGSLVEAVRAFQAQAEQLDLATEKAAAFEQATSASLARLNDSLAKVERAFLLEKGLPGRPWFKHAIYAPGLTTGYASWPLPAVHQDLEEKKDSRLAADVALTVERINQATKALETALGQADQVLKAH